MVETLVLKAEKREHTGTRTARKHRKVGKVPAIIYGHKQEPLAILLDYHDLALELQHHHRLLEVDLDGKKEKFLVKEVQFDYLGDKIVHLDLTRVDIDERVSVTVEVVLKGIPAGVTDGGTLDQIMAEIELECLVTSIPENIRANVSHLNLGEALLANDLELPSGAKLLTGADAHIAIVRAAVAEEVEEKVVDEEAGTAGPEVIAREKVEEKEK